MSNTNDTVNASGSRIRRWLQRQQLNIVATPNRVDTESNSRLSREAYCLTLHDIHDFELPDEIKKFRKNNNDKDLSIRLHVTFFDFATTSFYGNTYISPEIDLPEEVDDNEDNIWELKQLVYFSSTKNSNKCYAIMEVVGTTFDKSSTSQRDYSLAWSAIPLFNHRNMRDMDEVVHEDLFEEDFEPCRMFAGTPRSLMFYGDKWKSMAPPLSFKKRNACKVMFSMHTCLNILKAQHLLPDDFAFGPKTSVPGLEPVLLPDTTKLTPALWSKRQRRRPWTKPAKLNLDTPSPVDLSNFTLTLPRGMDAAVRKQIAIFAGSKNGLEDVVLRVGVHNCLCLTSPLDHTHTRRRGEIEKWTNIDMRQESRGIYRASMRRQLPHWYKDSNCALVFEVVYTNSRGSGILRRSYEDDDRMDILARRDDPPSISEVVVATGIFLPYDGERFVDNVDSARSRNNYNSSAGCHIALAPGAIFSPNGLVPEVEKVVGPTAGENVDEYDERLIRSSRDRRELLDDRRRKPQKNPSDEPSSKKKSHSMVMLDFSCAIDESESSRKKRRDLERKIKRRNRDRREMLIISREEQARGEAGRMKKIKTDVSDDEDEESEEEEEEPERRSRRRVTYEDDDNRIIDTAGSKSPDRMKSKKKKKENRSFFPSNGGESGKSEALSGLTSSTGSNSALVRSLLAQSLKQPLRPRNGPTTATIGGYAPNTTAVIGSATPLATELTRASRTFLSQKGFTDVLSDSVAPVAAAHRMPLPAPKRVSMDLELKDKLGANEVTFQFAAFRVVEGAKVKSPNSLYFTYQFFNALPTRTERMKLLGKGSSRQRGRRNGMEGGRGAFLNKRPDGSLSEPFVLCRERLRDDRRRTNRYGESMRDRYDEEDRSSSVPSLAIKYNVDTTLIPGESRSFAEYLCYKTLYIDVWDGESLMCMGTVAVDLRQLMRQGEPYVKNAMEYDVISSKENGVSMRSGHLSNTVHARSLPAGDLVGRLQLLTSNYGIMGKGPHDEESDRQAAIEGRSSTSSTTTPTGSGSDWRLGVPPSASDPASGAKHRVRAKPLTSSNPELRALIKSRHQAFDLGESRAQQRQRKDQWNNGMDDVRALTDANAISTIELNKLIDSYRGSRSHTIKWRDFLKSFAGMKKGGFTRSSSSRPDRKSRRQGGKKVNHLERQLRKILNAAKKEGLRLEDSFAHFDKNGNGKVNRSQFKEALMELNFKASDKEIQSLMARFDENGDGQITIAEFAEFATAPDVDGHISEAERKLHKILESAHQQGLEYEEAFESFDSDGDGQISKSEFSRALQDIFKPTKIELSRNEIDVLIRRFDLNNNGYITMKDFLRFARGSKGKSELATELRSVIQHSETAKGLSLRDAFRAFDNKDTGFITKSDFEQMLRNLGFHPTMDEVKQLFGVMDKDNSGDIELKEFERWVRNEARAEETSDESAMWRNGNNDDDSSSSLPTVPVELESIQRKIRDAIDRMVQESSTFDIESNFEHFDRKQTGEVTTQEFRYVLMDMKLSLLEGDEVQLQEEEHRKRAERMSRQLARIEAWRGGNAHNGRGGSKKSDEVVDSSGELIGRAQQLQKLYKLKSEDLQLVRRFRESRKRALVGTLLKSNITAEYTIHPSFGQTTFFEYQLTNPYSHEERFSIDVSDPELNVVSDSNVWQYYRDVLQPAAGVLSGQVEHDMIPKNTLELTLKARETVSIPFVFLSFASGPVTTDGYSMRATTRPRKDGRAATGWESNRSGDSGRDRDRDDDRRRGRDDYGTKDGGDGRGRNYGSKDGSDDRESDRDRDRNRDRRNTDQDNYDDMRQKALGHGVAIKRRSIPISFKSAHHGHTVALLQIHVRPRPFVVHRTFRFHQSENEFMKRRILIQPSGMVQSSQSHPYVQAPTRIGVASDDPASRNAVPPILPAKFVHCPANDVVVEWRDQKDPYRPQEIHLRYRCGQFPMVGQFFLCVYNDQYHASLHEVWHVTVQSMLRVDVHGLVGQGTPVELMCKGDNYSRRVMCYSSHASETAFSPSEPFQLVPSAYNKIEMIHRPLTVGTRQVQVHLVDMDTRELVAGWLVTTSSAAPIVSRTYDVDINVGKSAHKKIAYINKWDRARSFRLRTSDPNLVKAKDPRLNISGRGKGFIRLWFAPVQHAGTKEMFIFVNDEEDQNEECLLLRLSAN